MANPHITDYAVKITSETAREYQRRGAESKRRKREARKTMQQSLDILISKSLKKGNIDTIEQVDDIASALNLNISAMDKMLIMQIMKAMEGDTKAMEFVRDTLGEKPVEKVETQMTIEDYVKEHKVKF